MWCQFFGGEIHLGCLKQYITGWWFGTFCILHNIWDDPSHWLIFFKMVKTTNQISKL
jgi:hypothetical protein